MTTSTDADVVAVAALTQQVSGAWAQGDADSFTGVFADGGTMILAGVYCEGRDEIRDVMVKAFDGPYKGTQVTGRPISIRKLGPDVVLLLSDGGIIGAGETEVSEDSQIRASWLAVRQDDGGWLLAAYQNTPRNP